MNVKTSVCCGCYGRGRDFLPVTRTYEKVRFERLQRINDLLFILKQPRLNLIGCKREDGYVFCFRPYLNWSWCDRLTPTNGAGGLSDDS